MTDQIELGRITIRHLMTDGDVTVKVDLDGTPDESFVTFLGLMEFAKDSTLRNGERGGQ